MRLTLYCDESVEKGKYFSNFYGGALVRENFRQEAERRLNLIKHELNLNSELKWTKITENYADKYIRFIDAYFDLIRERRIKIRIMFSQNLFRARRLTPEQRENSYSILYYQFIKHAFGLQHIRNTDGISLSILLDDFPDKEEVLQRFREYLASLSAFPDFRAAGVRISRDDVSDVRSHEHVVLQGLDIILGAMQFRLNDKHLEKPVGKKRRGNRTRAKERVYKTINKHICEIYPRFNIGISTGTEGDLRNRWRHPYRHWVFIPSDYEIDESVGSKRRK